MVLFIIHCNCGGNWHIAKILHSYDNVLEFLTIHNGVFTGHRNTYLSCYQKQYHLYHVKKIEMR